ncbi:MAG: peptide-methionine (S)-S-oxide reductase MsrA [Patescibacteria group bacterium]|jgi:peptide-methionine (S)-S-oxide reductase
MATALFGAGCFWCTEAVMKSLKGVTAVRSGYAGGALENPSYEAVSTGATGHAEVVEVTFDPTLLTYEQLLEVFFGTHDPTQMNRQGNDIGTQYRSVIYYSDESQQVIAEAVKKRLQEDNTFGAPIVTAIEPAGIFYPAENYHQNYYALNPGNPYCQAIISPKVAKLRNKFAPLLKD